ncbi:MAG TPA: hypothetical protein VE441_12840 [Mycobacterium sp.]|jgi:MFS family permease|nr:hypothetical protein [Mycobacterium sp.]
MTENQMLKETRPSYGQAPAAPTGRSGAMWGRVTAVGGLVFFGLFIGFAALTSNTPAATDSRREVFSYLTQHHDRLQLAAALYGLAMAAALLFLAGLFAMLRKAEQRPRLAMAALAGGILAAAATVMGALVLGTTANRFLDLGPAGARTFWTMYLLSIGATLLGQVLVIGSTAAVSMRTNLLPRWFTVASVVLALASIVGAFTIGYATAGIQAVAGITAVLNAIWILLASFYLWRHPELASP